MTKPIPVLVYVLKNRETFADKMIEVCDNVVGSAPCLQTADRAVTESGKNGISVKLGRI
jgi:hypothetical protein